MFSSKTERDFARILGVVQGDIYLNQKFLNGSPVEGVANNPPDTRRNMGPFTVNDANSVHTGHNCVNAAGYLCGLAFTLDMNQNLSAAKR